MFVVAVTSGDPGCFYICVNSDSSSFALFLPQVIFYFQPYLSIFCCFSLGICTFCKPWEALCIGGVAAILTAAVEGATTLLKIDDPVGVIPVHLACGMWGVLSIGRCWFVVVFKGTQQAA